MARERLSALIECLVAATAMRDRYFEEHAPVPALGPPATQEQLDALAHHWKLTLPPSYREFLSQHNGMTRFWFDIPLLSTDQIVGDTQGVGTFEEPFPELWRTIFACDMGSYDALTFDPASSTAEGEFAVVLVGDEGEDERWPTFGEFLV